ncbi:hypothetical protein ACL00U_16900 (plasmid) [Curtobacterium poinsettiae]|uniref:hypothetical protein n=1 Tax=Curtobacterium poinsettiae TaxID=159612 RepID=UPI0039A08547
MEEQQVDVEIVPVDVEVHLPAHKREPFAELAESVDDPVDEWLLEVAFLRVAIQGDEVQHIWVFRDLLRQVRLGRWKDLGEVRRRRLQSGMRIGPDLVPEDIPGPAMRSRLGGVPVPELTIVEPVQEDGDVTPWQLCNSLLQSLLLRPSRPERTHVRKVAWGEPLDLRELRTQIRREPTDDVTPPPLIAYVDNSFDQCE